MFPEAVVIRSAGSKGPVDLIAIAEHGATMMQVKYGPRKPQAVPPIFDIPVSVIWWKPRASEPEIIEWSQRYVRAA